MNDPYPALAYPVPPATTIFNWICDAWDVDDPPQRRSSPRGSVHIWRVSGDDWYVGITHYGSSLYPSDDTHPTVRMTIVISGERFMMESPHVRVVNFEWKTKPMLDRDVVKFKLLTMDDRRFDYGSL